MKKFSKLTDEKGNDQQDNIYKSYLKGKETITLRCDSIEICQGEIRLPDRTK